MEYRGGRGGMGRGAGGQIAHTRNLACTPDSAQGAASGGSGMIVRLSTKSIYLLSLHNHSEVHRLYDEIMFYFLQIIAMSLISYTTKSYSTVHMSSLRIAITESSTNQDR